MKTSTSGNRENIQQICRGTTAKGAPCSLRARPGSAYCYHHDPEVEAKKVRKFFQKHRAAIRAFLGEAASDPLASDIHDFVIEELGLDHLIPLIQDKAPWLVKVSEASQHYKEHQDAHSLMQLIPSLHSGMNLSAVEELLTGQRKSPPPIDVPANVAMHSVFHPTSCDMGMINRIEPTTLHTYRTNDLSLELDVVTNQDARDPEVLLFWLVSPTPNLKRLGSEDGADDE